MIFCFFKIKCGRLMLKKWFGVLYIDLFLILSLTMNKITRASVIFSYRKMLNVFLWLYCIVLNCCIVLYWILHYLLSIYGGLFASWLFLWLYCIVVFYCIEFCTIYCLSMVVCLFPGCFYDCIVLLYCIVLKYALSFAIIEIINIAMHTLSLMHADMETSLSAVNPSCCVCYMKPLQIPGIVQGYIIYVINIYLQIIEICEALIFLG